MTGPEIVLAAVPVEQIQPGDTVSLPSGRRVRVFEVRAQPAGYTVPDALVVVYEAGGVRRGGEPLLQSLRAMGPGEAVLVERWSDGVRALGAYEGEAA